MIRVTRDIIIDENELTETFVHASGPGGQNVNKVATAVLLRFNVAHSPALDDEVRRRLMRLAGGRITTEGDLLIDARRFRSRERNRKDAVDRLVALIREAARRPKTRRRTQPTVASKARRLESKRRRRDIKRMRGRVRHDDE